MAPQATSAVALWCFSEHTAYRPQSKPVTTDLFLQSNSLVCRLMVSTPVIHVIS